MGPIAKKKLTAKGMLRVNTPVEDYRKQYGLLVKREDLSCPPPGPPFSKTRGVFYHIEKREEKIIGVLDTSHSQAGHAVARACALLGKECWSFFPVYKAEKGERGGYAMRGPTLSAIGLGAKAKPLDAGRSCILFHQARKRTEAAGGYMMPNALKLDETFTETANEVDRTRSSRIKDPAVVIIPASSGTIAAGVIRGFGPRPVYVVHMGYSRSPEAVRRYLLEHSGVPKADINIVDEGYAYKDKAEEGETPPWPCNAYYDLKAFRWWLREGRGAYSKYGPALFWNIG